METAYDPVNGIFNSLFSRVSGLTLSLDDGSGFPTLKKSVGGPFLVQNIFTDFKRHDLGADFHERNYDGTIQRQFITRAP